jgi:hypothetical protein
LSIGYLNELLPGFLAAGLWGLEADQQQFLFAKAKEMFDDSFYAIV